MRYDEGGHRTDMTIAKEPILAKEPIIELLRSQYKSLDFLGSSLTTREWHARAALPGWSVFDVYAHIIGTESMLEGDSRPEVLVEVSTLTHVRNEIGELNETWVESMVDLGPQAMLDRFREVTASRLRSLAAMNQRQFDAESPTPLGPTPYGRFMQIRLFDCWMHEQDIREGLGRPGHESGPCARASVEEAIGALGYIVGKKAAAPEGSLVTIELTGPVRRKIHVEVVEGRARMTDDPPRPATTVITMSSSLFMRLAGGRAQSLSTRLGSISFDGDLALAQRVVTNLAFTI